MALTERGGGGKEVEEEVIEGNEKRRSGVRGHGNVEGGLVIHIDPLQGKLFIAFPSLSVRFALNLPKFIIHIPAFTIYLVWCQTGLPRVCAVDLTVCLRLSERLPG